MARTAERPQRVSEPQFPQQRNKLGVTGKVTWDKEWAWKTGTPPTLVRIAMRTDEEAEACGLGGIFLGRRAERGCRYLALGQRLSSLGREELHHIQDMSGDRAASGDSGSARKSLQRRGRGGGDTDCGSSRGL